MLRSWWLDKTFFSVSWAKALSSILPLIILCFYANFKTLSINICIFLYSSSLELFSLLRYASNFLLSKFSESTLPPLMHKWSSSFNCYIFVLNYRILIDFPFPPFKWDPAVRSLVWVVSLIRSPSREGVLRESSLVLAIVNLFAEFSMIDCFLMIRS